MGLRYYEKQPLKWAYDITKSSSTRDTELKIHELIILLIIFTHILTMLLMWPHTKSIQLTSLTDWLTNWKNE